jgi:hypothetical protein
MAVGQRKDPYRNSRFLVEIDGIVQAGFSEVTIPDSSNDVVDYREGNDPPTTRKLPGLVWSPPTRPSRRRALRLRMEAKGVRIKPGLIRARCNFGASPRPSVRLP